MVSRLGVGCGSVGGLMVRGDAAEQQRMIGHALEAGVTYFDTAPSYGDGRSEENLGRVLAALDDGGRALVGTKVGLSSDELGNPAAAIRRSLEASLRRLGRERVDLFQLHNRLQESPAAGDEGGAALPAVLGEIGDAMRRAVEDGLVGHIGFTGLGETGAVLRAVDEGPFETVQAYFNVLNPSGVWPGTAGGEQDFEGLIGRASGRGVGVINIRVYAAGALAGDVVRHPIAAQMGGRPLVPGAAYTEDVARSKGPAQLAAELGLESGMEIGLRFALGAPGIATVLVGLSSFEQLETALRWERRGPLEPSIADRVLHLARA